MQRLMRLEDAGPYQGKCVPGHRLDAGCSLEIGTEVSEETANRLLTTFPEQFAKIDGEALVADDDEFGEVVVAPDPKPSGRSKK